MAALVVVTQVQAQEKKPESAATVVARVQKYYDATKDLRAKFEQQLESASRAPSKASGEVLLKKPGKMRWDYAKPDKKLMVSDGATLWVYEPEDEQAYKQDLKGNALPAQVSFLLGEGKLDKEFDASLTKVDGLGADELALKMVPEGGHDRVSLSRVRRRRQDRAGQADDHLRTRTARPTSSASSTCSRTRASTTASSSSRRRPARTSSSRPQ